MNIISEKYSIYKNRYSAQLGHQILDCRPSDCFIAASPRSGSTWLRTMISIVRFPDVELQPELYNRTIPAVSIRNAIKIRRLASPRIIMTHSKYSNISNRTIYVVRDGRDAIVSFYHYNSDRAGHNLGFSDFLNIYYKHYYGPTWADHVRSWLGKGRNVLADKLMLIRFEDMRAHPERVLEAVCRFLELSCDDRLISRAVQAASIANMRKLEEAEGGRTISANQSFYRGGRVEQWRDYFDSGTAREFAERAGDAMRMAGYVI